MYGISIVTRRRPPVDGITIVQSIPGVVSLRTLRFVFHPLRDDGAVGDRIYNSLGSLMARSTLAFVFIFYLGYL